MSKFATKEQLYKAKSEHWEKRFKCLALMCECELADDLPGYQGEDEYIYEVTDFIDSEISDD